MPELNININKDSNDGENPQNPVSVGEEPVKTRDPGKRSFMQSAVGTAIVQAGKQMIISGIQHAADLSGDYATVRAIQSATQAVGDLITVAKYGPAGVIFVATSHATNALNSFVGLENTRREEDMRRQRAGRISTKGSRY